MSTPDDDDALQQGLAGALLAPGQPNPFPGLALSLLGNPGRPQAPSIPISLAQGLTLGSAATSGPAPGTRGSPTLTPVPAASADDAPVAADALPDTERSPAANGGQPASPFDVDEAVEYLDKHATSRYIDNKINGHCGKAVRLAIAAGGRQVANTDDAKDYGPKLVEAGFNQLDAQGLKNYTPQKGDVVVYPASPGHDSGHMGMYDGTQWVSDFKQRHRWIDRHGRPEPAFEIYRP